MILPSDEDLLYESDQDTDVENDDPDYDQDYGHGNLLRTTTNVDEEVLNERELEHRKLRKQQQMKQGEWGSDLKNYVKKVSLFHVFLISMLIALLGMVLAFNFYDHCSTLSLDHTCQRMSGHKNRDIEAFIEAQLVTLKVKVSKLNSDLKFQSLPTVTEMNHLDQFQNQLVKLTTYNQQRRVKYQHLAEIPTATFEHVRNDFHEIEDLFQQYNHLNGSDCSNHRICIASFSGFRFTGQYSEGFGYCKLVDSIQLLKLDLNCFARYLKDFSKLHSSDASTTSNVQFLGYREE